VLIEGFNSPLVFSPLDLLVDAEQGGDRGPGVSCSGDVSIRPVVTTLEQKEFLPTITSQRGERTTKDLISVEGRHTKVIWCAHDRAGSERLVFGEDIAMDRVLNFTERAVVG